MTTYYLSPFFHTGIQFTSSVGAPLANGKIYTYNAGTTTPANTVTSNTGAANNPNPILLDSTGRLVNEIWMAGGQALKFVVTDSANVQVGITLDNVSGINDITNAITQVTVINSVSSSDTSNAASANAAKWAYEEANSAYKAANAAYAQANAAYAQANSGAGNVLIHEAGTLVGSGINFMNSATMNVNVQSNTQFSWCNISIEANSSSYNVLAGSIGTGNSNGWCFIPGTPLMFQWGYSSVTSGAAASLTVNFPKAFNVNVVSVVVSSNRSGTAGGGTNFVYYANNTLFKGIFDYDPSTSKAGGHWIAIGY